MAIKIGFLVSTLKNTGPIKVVYNIVSNLDSNYESIIITLSPEPKDTLISEFEKLGCKIIGLKLSRTKGFFNSGKLLKNLVSKENIDIIHSHGFRPDIISCSLNSVAGISTLHNNPYKDYPLKYGHFKGKLMALIHMFYLKKNRLKVVCCSQTIKNELENIITKATFVQNGINLEGFVSEDYKSYWREELGLSKDNLVFLTTGSFIKRKNNEFVIQAFLKLISNYDIQLLLLGAGPEKERLTDLCKDTTKIKIVGKVQDIKPYLWSSDYLVSASSSEGLPNGVLEAAASGIQPILSNIEPHQEIFRDNSDLALFFRLNDMDDLINTINSAITKRYSKGDSNLLRDLVTSNFTSKKMTNSYQDIYTDYEQPI